MKCPRCGQPLPPGAKFCAHCGLALASAPGATGMPMAANASQPRPANPTGQHRPQTPPSGYGMPTGFVSPGDSSKKKAMLIGLLCAIALIAVGWGLKTAGLLRFGSKLQTTPVTAVSHPAPVPVAMRGNLTPTPVGQQAPAAPQMPPDVLAWLKHLQQVEEEKVSLSGKESDELQALIPAMQSLGGVSSPEEVNRLTDPDTTLQHAPGSRTIDQLINGITTDWNKLQADFNSMPPPAECQPIADAYNGGLTGTIQTAGQIAQIVNGINTTDPNLQSNINSSTDQLRGIKKSHVNDVDAEFTQTDELVQEICDKYDVKKWFKIDAHGSAGSIFSQAGL